MIFCFPFLVRVLKTVYIWLLWVVRNREAISERKSISCGDKCRRRWALTRACPGSSLPCLSFPWFCPSASGPWHHLTISWCLEEEKRPLTSVFFLFRGPLLGFSLCLIGQNWITDPFLGLPWMDPLVRGMGLIMTGSDQSFD